MRPLALSSEEETETQRGEGLAVRSPSQLIGGSWTWGRAFWLHASSRWGVPEATCSPSASQGTVKEGARVARPRHNHLPEVFFLESSRRMCSPHKPRPHHRRPRLHFPQALTLYPDQPLISLCLLPKQLKSFRSWLESAGEVGGGGWCWGRGWRETKPSSSLETVCSADGLLKILFLQVQKGKRGDSWVGEMLLVDSCVQEGGGAGSGGWGVGGAPTALCGPSEQQQLSQD